MIVVNSSNHSPQIVDMIIEHVIDDILYIENHKGDLRVLFLEEPSEFTKALIRRIHREFDDGSLLTISWVTRCAWNNFNMETKIL